MPLRLTTWNVNGIRNPFSYQPWSETRSFERMFEILEADIVVFQETKIQKKDLTDDMVLIPGWDSFFSLPRQKKGYSGVVIYTRCSTCTPIRAEEGLTGILSPPGSDVSYKNQPESNQIGGYLTNEQIGYLSLDPMTIDSEGRCVVLEFPAFVLLGVYCPANRDQSRDSFRTEFFKTLDMRVRNLISLGKRVILMGDLNISSDVKDSAHAIEAIRKSNTTETEFLSSPLRQAFNNLVSKEELIIRGEGSVLLDLCRKLHPDRLGMYTCWEQRVNARPGNYGARIDYILCSAGIGEWFVEANIQEGLMGSDHCPVYAILKDIVTSCDTELHLLDLMNPPGTFEDGTRKIPITTSSLPLCGRLLPEFRHRRSLKDMFRVASIAKPLSKRQSSSLCTSQNYNPGDQYEEAHQNPRESPAKRTLENTVPLPIPKRSKKLATKSKSQQTLSQFVKLDTTSSAPLIQSEGEGRDPKKPESTQVSDENFENILPISPSFETRPLDDTPYAQTMTVEEQGVRSSTRDSWAKLFSKKAPPRCEGHDEPCIVLATKKPGPNCGRSFWICSRPLGPSGDKELGTPWRCPTFFWCSDWKSQAQS